MSGLFGGTPATPLPANRRVVASYDDYAGAQKAVDSLSDQGFPVQHVSIVGSDLQIVENVTGRLTYGRAALGGAVSGAWFGLLFGLILSLLGGEEVNAGAALFGGLLIGAGGGVFFAIIAFAATRGQRDFASRRSIVATRYQVMVAPEHAARAGQLLGGGGGAFAEGGGPAVG